MPKFLRIFKKFQRLLVKIALSVLIAGIIFTIYLAFKTPIKNAINGDGQELNFDYTIIQDGNDVQGISTGRNNVSYAEVAMLDSRAWVFDQYLTENNSPLAGYGRDFAAACDKYNTPRDCTLLIAIAKVETDLCKTGISAQQYNCWGYGGSGSNRINYSSFPEAIDSITGRLMNGYKTRFFEDPEAGELFYCGAHCDTWGDKVKAVQNQLKAYGIELGYELQ